MTRQTLPQYRDAVGASTDIISRRTFVAGGSAAVAALSAAGLGACATMAVRQVEPINGRLELPLIQYPELTAPDGALRVRVPGDQNPIYVLATASQGFTALSPLCTHLGCTVDIQGASLVCPCHGSTYNREGAVVRGPAERPLRRYRATVGSDRVLVIDLTTGATPNG